MESNRNERKPRKKIDVAIFELIKRLRCHNSISEVAEITGVSYSAVSKCIQKIESFGPGEPQFTDIFAKPGRHSRNKSALHAEIRNIVGNDNSLTQIGVREKLSSNISRPQLCREFKAAGLKRKRIKKNLALSWQLRVSPKRNNFALGF